MGASPKRVPSQGTSYTRHVHSTEAKENDDLMGRLCGQQKVIGGRQTKGNHPNRGITWNLKLSPPIEPLVLFQFVPLIIVLMRVLETSQRGW